MNDRNRYVRRLGLLLALALLPLNSGCNQNTDLAAVQTMATQTAASKATFDAISADFYDSCVRGLKFAFPANSLDVSTCDPESKASSLWQGANAILLSYIASLGALATDKQTDYGLTQLASTVAGIQGVTFKTAQQSAVVGAGKTLLGGIFAARRKNELGKIMAAAEKPDPANNCPNGCLNDLIANLTSIAQDDYGATILTAEDGRIQLFYTNYISLAEGKAGKGSGGSAALASFSSLRYRLDEASARQAVVQKRAAIKQYVAALAAIQTAHHQIVEAIENNDPDQIAGIVNSFVSTYSAQLSSVKKAFP